MRSPLRSAWRRLLPDNFTLALLGTVTLATLLPCRGEVARGFSLLTDLAIVLLFFLHGAKLSREAILSGLAHYRLHLLVFASTFVLFPALGLLTGLLPSSLLGPELASGFLFLCLLPSTVQSSIAFTSMAGGNVPAAVCSASISNVLGIFITPVLTGALLGAQGAGVSLGAIRSILLQLLAPFVLGHLLRPVIGAFVDRHKSVLSFVDRGSILLVVYTAFSEAVVEGLWQKVSGFDLLSSGDAWRNFKSFPLSSTLLVLDEVVLVSLDKTDISITFRPTGAPTTLEEKNLSTPQYASMSNTLLV